MSSPHALMMPREIWLKIAGHLRPDLIYCVRACCSPPIPSPGADIVGPLFTPAFTRDIFNLSCACRILRSILKDDIKSVLSLYMRRRHRDNILVHQPRSGWPPCNTSNDEENYSESAAEIHEIATLPLGSHVRHLRLALRELNYYSFETVTTLSQEYCDDAVPIIRGVPFLQSLKISARFNQPDHAFNLSPVFCQALATLQHLHTLKILGLTIPADCPILRWVEHLQTDTQIHSFESFPRLKDLRYVPEASLLSYNIPSNVLARLEILHYYPPDKDDDCALLPQELKDRDAPSDHPLLLRELVLTGYPRHNELLDIVHGLASPHLHTFVCFGLGYGDEVQYNDIIEVIGKVFPNLTTLKFPISPFHDHSVLGDGNE